MSAANAAAALIASFPKSTPEWVINEFFVYEKLMNYKELHLIIRSRHITPAFWQRLAEVEGERQARKELSDALISRLLPLGEFLRRAMGFVAEQRLTKKERREIAEEIKKPAQGLIKKLGRFRDADEYPEWTMASHDLGGVFGELIGEIDLADMPREQLEVHAWVRGAFAVLQRPQFGVRALLAVVEQWEKPRGVTVHKPTLESARRTFFIGVLERGFRSRYGHPMAELIDPMVATLFEELPALDKSDIAKRLPTRLARTKGPKD